MGAREEPPPTAPAAATASPEAKEDVEAGAMSESPPPAPSDTECCCCGPLNELYLMPGVGRPWVVVDLMLRRGLPRTLPPPTKEVPKDAPGGRLLLAGRALIPTFGSATTGRLGKLP